MTAPLFQATTAKELASYAAALPHALLLHGKEGVGLRTAAEYLVAQAGAEQLVILPEYDQKVNLEKGKITIDVIRRLYEQTRGRQTKRQCIIIEAFDTITVEAQQAFLKLLEEPGDKVSFLLLCHQPSRLLPTIRSRVQQVHIRQISREQSESLLDSLYVKLPAKRAQLLFMAQGRPAALTRFVADEAAFEKEADLLRTARQLLQSETYQRLAIVQSLRDNRAKAQTVVEYMLLLLRFDMTQKKQVTADTLRKLTLLETAVKRLRQNSNVRLALALAMV